MTRGDVYAAGDALADVLQVARDARRDHRVLGYCRECRQTACPPTCTRGQLLVWLARIDDETSTTTDCKETNP